MANEYILESKDDWFIKQKRKDLFTQEYFKEGDSVVLCAKCHTVMLSDAWKFYGNRCLNCKHDTTIPFSKENCEYFKGSNSNINIIGNIEKEDDDENFEEIVSREELEEMNQKFVFFISLYTLANDTIKKNEKNLHRLRIFCMVSAILLLIGSTAFTVMHPDAVKEKYIASVSAPEKAAAIENAKAKMTDAKDNVKADKDSLFEHSTDSLDKNIELAKKNFAAAKSFGNKTVEFFKLIINKPIEFFRNI